MSLGRLRYQHKGLLEMGGFLDGVDCSGFPEKFIVILNKYGHWMEALYSKKISPITTEQERFIDVCISRARMETEYEFAFVYSLEYMDKLKNVKKTKGIENCEHHQTKEKEELEDLIAFRDHLNRCTGKELDRLNTLKVLQTLSPKKKELLERTILRNNWKAPEEPDAYGGTYSTTDGQ